MVPFPQLVSEFLSVRSRSLLGSMTKRVQRIKQFAPRLTALSDGELRQWFETQRARVADNTPIDEIEIPLFAVIAEASKRRLGLTPFDVQLLAALVMRRGMVAQMNTGEGKTLVAPFIAIAEAICGNRSLVVTANPYLSRRDFEWMSPLYDFFGIAHGVRYSDDSVWPSYAEYDFTVTYVSTDALLTDFLFKHSSVARDRDVPIARNVAVLDEIDEVLIEKGRRAHNLTSAFAFDTSAFVRAKAQASRLQPGVHYVASPQHYTLEFTDAGRGFFRTLLDAIARDPAESMFYLRSTLRAHALFRRDVDYIVQNGRIVPLDQVSGLPNPASSYEFGIQQALEEKEGLPRSSPSTLVGSTTAQGYYAGFSRLCGMSGSAVHNSLELKLFYRLDVIPIPPRLPVTRADIQDLVYRTRPEQVRAVVAEVVQERQKGRPVLVGTLSVEDAEAVAEALTAIAVPYQLLTARNYQEQGEMMSRAGEARMVTIAAKLAGRGVDIVLTDEARHTGGLHIVGMCRANERRLDEQLQGRTARQGDPGSARFILSLEDDLLQTFGSKRLQPLMKSLGMEQDVPIEHGMVTNAIRRSQRQLTLNACIRRHFFLLLDECTRDARKALFHRRERLAPSYVLSDYVEELILRYLARQFEQSRHTATMPLVGIAAALSVTFPADLQLLEAEDPRLVSSVAAFLNEEYVRRRGRAGIHAAPRERLIVLRCIDLSWAGFMVTIARKTDRATLGGGDRSSFSLLADLLPLFVSERERLVQAAEDRTVSALFQIDRPQLLLGLKHWCGDREDHGDGIGDADLIRGATSPSGPNHSGEAKRLEVLQHFERHPESIVPDASLPDYLAAYREEVRTFESCVQQQPKIQRALALYERYLRTRDVTVANARMAGEEFLRETRFRPARLRQTFVRDVLNDFNQHLERQGLIPRLHPELVVAPGHRFRFPLFLQKLGQPVMMFKLVYLVLFIALYHTLNSIPLPFGDALAAGAQDLPLVPDLVLEFVNIVLLGGSWNNMTLGVVGIAPILVTGAVARLAQPNWSRTPAIAALPAAFVMCLVTTLWGIDGFGDTTAGSLINAATLFGALFAATTLILVMVDAARLIDLLSGVRLVILVNVTAWLVTLVNGTTSAAGVVGFAGVLGATLVCALASRRLSAVTVDIVKVEQPVAGTVGIERQTSALHVDTVLDDSHEFVAFLAAAYVGTLAAHPPMTTVTLAILMPLTFGAVVYVMLRSAVNRQLSPARILLFLEAKDTLLADGDSGFAALLRRLRSTTLRNAILSIVMVAGLMAAAIALGRYSAPLASVNPFLFAVAVTVWANLGAIAIRQLRFFLTGYSSPLAIVLSTAEDSDEDEGLSIFARYWKRALAHGHGLLGLLVLVGGLVQLAEYAWRLVRWIWGLTQ